ncbi:MAG: hypothetical protein J6B77_02555 [Clostridia bacterium]|nr:hypothetical protein [Clostridia bacterium]
MKFQIDAASSLGQYVDPTAWQNSTLRYSPPEDFPAFLSKEIGRAKIMRAWITLDEYWDYRTNEFYPDYDIGVARYAPETLHYVYDWASIVPAPSGTRFKAYLTTHAENADEILLNVRRLEREVSDGVITYEQYEEIFEKAVEYCKSLAPNIRYVECCNEVDIKVFGLLSAEEYAKIYLCAYRAVKRLNEKHHYDVPLLVGGYAAAHPLHQWKLMQDVMHILKNSEIGECPMDFYSYHLYNLSASSGLFQVGRYAEAELGGVGKLRRIMEQHKELLAELDLPEKPVFLNELGRARTTGVDGDSLYNASGLLTYLIAFGSEGLEGMYLFPWCTFHNPKLQISFTQYLLKEDGTYAATPNGLAVKMLHSLSGERLPVTVSEACGKDTEFYAVASKDENGISVVCTNPNADAAGNLLEICGLEDGSYHIEGFRCDHRENNIVTGSGTGTLQKTGEAIRTAENGVLLHRFFLDKHAFILYRITKI